MSKNALSQRMTAAAAKAVVSHAAVARAAKKVTEEMDEVTANEAIPVTGLDVEDSAVIVVAEMIASATGKS